MYTYIHVHEHINVDTHICILTYMCMKNPREWAALQTALSTHTSILAQTYVYLHTHIYTDSSGMGCITNCRAYIHINVGTHICIHNSAHMYTYIHIYTQIHRNGLHYKLPYRPQSVECRSSGSNHLEL